MDKKHRMLSENWFLSFFWGVVCTMTLSVNVVVADAGIAGQDLKFGMEYDGTAITLENAPKLLVLITKLRQNFPLDSWAWGVGAAALAFLFHSIAREKQAKPGKGVAVMSFVFAVTQVLGLSICKLDSWAFVSENLYQALLAAFCIAGYAALFYHAVWGLYILLERVSGRQPIERARGFGSVFRQHPGTVSSILILLGWTPWVLACLPGSVDWDSHTQICQMLGSMEMTAHHTVLSTWMHGGCLLLGRAMGSDNLGVFIYILLQCLFCAWVYGQVVSFCAKLKCPELLQYGVTVFFALVPVWGAFAQSMVKDTLFAAIIALFALKTAEICLFRSEYNARPVLYFQYLLIAFLTCLLRKNGIVAVCPVLIFVAIKEILQSSRNWIPIATPVILVVAVAVFNAFTTNVLGIASGGINEALSIPMQQTARYIVVYGSEVTDEERAAIDKVLDYEEIADSYDPFISDGVKELYKSPSQDEIVDYFKVWFSMFLKHPSCYIQATQANSYGYLYNRREQF